MAVKIAYPINLTRHFTTTFHLEFEHEGEMHQIEVARVDELQDGIDAIAGAAGIPVEQMFVTRQIQDFQAEVLLQETQKDLCHFHVQAMMRLKDVLGYESTEDLLTLLNAATVRIKRLTKELGEKEAKPKG